MEPPAQDAEEDPKSEMALPHTVTGTCSAPPTWLPVARPPLPPVLIAPPARPAALALW